VTGRGNGGPQDVTSGFFRDATPHGALLALVDEGTFLLEEEGIADVESRAL
jgi:hypothetical protein